MLKNLFTAVTALHYWTERSRNDGPKSEEFQGYPRYDALQWCVDWGNSHHLTVKGHPLFWTVPKAIPEWLKRYDYATQLKFLEVRIRSITARFRHKIRLYDIINEAMWEPALRNLKDRQWPYLERVENWVPEIASLLEWARSEDPDARYLVNEYGVVANDHTPIAVPAHDGTQVTPHRQLERLIELLNALQKNGTPPDAVGLQSHTGNWLTPASQWDTYDRISNETGLPVHITEFWAKRNAPHLDHLPEEEKDRVIEQYIVQVMTCAFAHPAVDAFFFWGVTDQLITFSNDGGWELTPLYHRLYDLIHKKWRTCETLRTGAHGIVKCRCFTGDYQLRLCTEKGKRTAGKLTIPAGSTTYSCVHQLACRVKLQG
ncbi:MAG: hypothetical protein D6820_06425 [Lentisphaerae bacterium]|nr:MAG: hypothetical protein D6820_06425 [Lentisphaerota bacterium]